MAYVKFSTLHFKYIFLQYEKLNINKKLERFLTFFYSAKTSLNNSLSKKSFKDMLNASHI